jgi:hypothetical protein
VQPNLPDEAVARIEPWNSFHFIFPVATRVGSVDGARVAQSFTWRWATARLVPGEHSIVVEISSPGYTPMPDPTNIVALQPTVRWSPLEFKHTFAAGHVYEVRCEYSPHHRVILVDKTCGQQTSLMP